MSEDINLLKLVCDRLEKANIQYMLTGSMASNFYTIPRMTRDIDIVIEMNSKSDIEIFFQLFHKDFYIQKSDIFDAITHQRMFNIIHNDTMLKIDLIIRENSSYENIKFQRRTKIALGDSKIWIISPEDLIISKLFWAKDSFSEMQIKDIANIFQSQIQINKEYIIHWVDLLKLNHIYNKVKKNE